MSDEREGQYQHNSQGYCCMGVPMGVSVGVAVGVALSLADVPAACMAMCCSVSVRSATQVAGIRIPAHKKQRETRNNNIILTNKFYL